MCYNQDMMKMKTMHKASDILKFLTGCCKLVLYVRRDGLGIMIYWLEDDLVAHALHSACSNGDFICCSMNAYDTYETRCKKYLDSCFEVAQEHDIWGYMDQIRRGDMRMSVPQVVLRRGTCLESVLIEMDMQIA